MAIRLDQLRFDNRLIRELPGDSGPHLTSRPTPGVIYTHTLTTPIAKPELLAWSDSCAEMLGITRPEARDGIEAQILSGNKLAPGMSPYSTRYGGHQFGHWAGQLGDGRAICLGEALNSNSERFEIQLKGAGLTPYSRRADGRAVLRSSLREFLCSEAMFHLGVPTTRALACVTTGEMVMRDMFYDGNPAPEPGAIVTRVAPTFLRFGHFEILATSGETELLRRLVSHTVFGHFEGFDPSTDEGIVSWFKEVCRRTGEMLAHWMRVGFVHGVMNTDNMSILGLTIDYGPYGWLDVYDPDWTPNTTDHSTKRYRYGQQPAIALWNLVRLAEALSPIVKDHEALEDSLKSFDESFGDHFGRMLAQKIGLVALQEEADEELARELDSALRKTEIDMTIFYRSLAKVLDADSRDAMKVLHNVFYEAEPAPEAVAAIENWVQKWRARLALKDDSRAAVQARMNRSNPYFILRNYLVQEALDELAEGARSKLDCLMNALQTPYEENSTTQAFFKRRPEWARNRAGCSALSCSS